MVAKKTKNTNTDRRARLLFVLAASLTIAVLNTLFMQMNTDWLQLQQAFAAPFRPSAESLMNETEGQETTEMFPLKSMPSVDWNRSNSNNSKESTVSAEEFENIPVLGEQEEAKQLRRRQVLSDPLNRVSQDFHVPKSLRQRTEFWFDIYTKYGENHHVIHHLRYPWIVYKVVDGQEIMNSGKGPTWLRRQKVARLVSQERSKIRLALKKLAARKNYKKLSPLEKEMVAKLEVLPGNRRRIYSQAAQNIRSQLGQRDFFEAGLQNSSRYLAYMEEEFAKRDMPIELTRLPFVESSFNEQAQSKVGASGVWQIMPSTGRAYMIVSSVIDERNSPLKATATAAQLLRQYYRTLKLWPLTITAYNNGIGNIQVAMRKARSHDLGLIIERYHEGDFKFASSNFFTCFLAALYAEKYHDVVFERLPRQPLLEREVLRLTKASSLREVRRITGLDAQTLIEYNLDLRDSLNRNARLPKGFELHLPPGFRQRLTEALGSRQPNKPVIKKSSGDSQALNEKMHGESS